jgi:HEAT repeat protein
MIRPTRVSAVHSCLANFEYIPPAIFPYPRKTGRGFYEMEKTFAELKNMNNPDRWAAVIALERFGNPAVDYLIKALMDEDKWVRYVAADALGNVGDSRAVDSLLERLNDPDQDVRFATAGALGRIGDERASKHLMKTCSSDNCFVRIAAEEALASIKTNAQVAQTRT